MVRALKILKKIFDKHDIPFWLGFGTLLGAIREKKLISWDDDIDICIWIQDSAKIADTRKDFEESEFELYIIPLHIPTHGFGHYAIRDRKTKKHLICIFPTYIEKGYIVKARVLPVIGNIIRYFHIIKSEWLLRLSWSSLLKHHLYKDEKILYPVGYHGNTTTIEFYGSEFRIPEKYKECLRYMYGDWKIPIRGYRGVAPKHLVEV